VEISNKSVVRGNSAALGDDVFVEAGGLSITNSDVCFIYYNTAP
jgi:hypothetical protein